MEIETWLTQDLNKPVKVQSISGNLFSQDNMANLIGVEIMDGNQPATVSGIVSANVLRADGATVEVTGTLTGNKASVILPQAAYAVPGMTAVVIKLIDGEEVTTVGALQAIVYRSVTDLYIDPGTIIPDIQTLIERIDTASSHYPKIEDGTWWEWDVANQTWVDTEIDATGPQGEKGDKGDTGDPGIDVEVIGHTLVITKNA